MGLDLASDGHIVAGMFQHFGTPAFDFWLEIGVKIFTAICVAVFTYQTFLAALRQTRAGEVWIAGTMYLPVWPCRWLLPLSRRPDGALPGAAGDRRRQRRELRAEAEAWTR